MSGIRGLDVKHLIGGAVAASAVAMALAGGGFEPTAYAAAGLVVWIAVVIGLAVGVLPRSQPPTAALVAGISLAGLAALTALSLAWASDDGNGFEDVVRTLAYLGAFAAVVLASRRNEATPWLAGLAVGVAAIAAIALLARFEPSLFGNPDADLADLPAVLGRLIYPIGYWNGLAAVMAAAIVLLSWFAATAGSVRARAGAVAALPPVLLALWMTDSRGGIAAAVIAFGVLLVVGPRRSLLLANLALGVAFGAILIAVAETYDTLLNAPTAPAAGGEGDRMLVITLAGVAFAFAARMALDRFVQPLLISRRLAIAGLAVVAVVALVGLIAIDPIQQYDEFKAPPSNDVLASGDVGLLRGGGSGRYQFWETAVDAFASDPIGGVGASGYTPYWFEHREIPIPATRAHSALFETLAELGIAGLGLLLTFFGTALYCGVRRARAREPVARGRPGAGAAGRRRRHRGGRLDLGPAGRVRDHDRRRSVAHGSRDPRRPGSGASLARAARPGAPPPRVRGRRRAAPRRLDLDLRLRPAVALGPLARREPLGRRRRRRRRGDLGRQRRDRPAAVVG